MYKKTIQHYYIMSKKIKLYFRDYTTVKRLDNKYPITHRIVTNNDNWSKIRDTYMDVNKDRKYSSRPAKMVINNERFNDMVKELKLSNDTNTIYILYETKLILELSIKKDIENES